MLGATICSYFLDGPKHVMSSSGVGDFNVHNAFGTHVKGMNSSKDHQATDVKRRNIESPDVFLLCRFTDFSW